MSVGFFLPTLAGGGAERVVLDLCEGFAAAGVDTRLVVGSGVGELRQSVPDSVRLFDLGASRTSRAVTGLARFLRHERPEVLYSALNHANVIATVAASLSRSGARLVLAEHIQLSRYAASAPSRRDRLMPLLVRHAYRRADGIVAVSDGVAKDLASICRIPTESVTVVRNPINVRRLEQQCRAVPDHIWFREQPRPVVSIGRLEPQKGFDVLVRAVGQAARCDRERRLVLLGEGTERRRLEHLAAQEGVELFAPGFVHDPHSYVANGGMFVMSSRWEGLPLVLLEALAVGVPVIATDCESGPREILRGGELGNLVPVDDVNALTSAVDEVRAGGTAALQPRLPAEYSLQSAVAAYAAVGGISTPA